MVILRVKRTMAKLTKRQQKVRELFDKQSVYSFDQAVEILKKASNGAKFEESFDVSINLGVDPRKSDQVVRGSALMPSGTGKVIRTAVFAQGDNATKAADAGADIVGFEDLCDKIKSGFMDFDVVIATPDAMRVVSQLGQILGPRGLMPNPKVGTVTADVAAAVNNAKAGQVRFRTDKNGIVHCSVGKVKFSAEQLQSNVNSLLAEVKKLKPASSKGVYIRKITVSTTMGPGLSIDPASVAE